MSLVLCVCTIFQTFFLVSPKKSSYLFNYCVVVGVCMWQYSENCNEKEIQKIS